MFLRAIALQPAALVRVAAMVFSDVEDQAPLKRGILLPSMNTLGAGMASGEWTSSVTIELTGKSRTYARIKTTRDAAFYLVDSWPGQRDESYKEAIVTCAKALKGQADDLAAFEAFVHAAVSSRLRFQHATAATADQFEQDIMREARRSIVEDLRRLSKAHTI